MNRGFWESFGQARPLLDEGGIRCVHDTCARWVSYLEIAEVSITGGRLQRRLVIDSTSSDDVDAIRAELPFGVDATGIVRELLERRTAARATEARQRARRGELGAWIATVAASAGAGASGLYRMSSIEDGTLDEVLADTTDAAPARAAAAHLLLARGRADLVRRRIGPLTPPIVVAAARLGRHGARIVSDALLQTVLPFLGLRDRIVFAQRAQRALVA